MTAADALPCRFLEWDSAFFGKRVASVAHARLDGGRARLVLDWARGQQIDCLYVLTTGDDIDAAQAVEEAGGRLVDVRMTFGLSLAGATPASGALPNVRPGVETDIAALRALAATSHTTSRFYADRRFPRERCDELYATWIERSCRGWADRVWVAVPDGVPAGYLSCHIREGGRGEVGLVAVAPAAQGRGVGRALLQAALAYFTERAVDRVSVVTQGRNTRAQGLYQAMGFRTEAVDLWHHLWLDAGATGAEGDAGARGAAGVGRS